MKKNYVHFIIMISLFSTIFSMDDNPVRFALKTHQYGRPGISQTWSLNLSRNNLKKHFQDDAQRLTKSINKKFPIKICDATIDCIVEENPDPSTIAAMVIWTCRNWGQRADGTPEKKIIKTGNDSDAVERWTIGITSLVDRAEYNKLHNYSISEDTHMVASQLKQYRYDDVINKISKELLQRLAQFEQIQEKNLSYPQRSSKTMTNDPLNCAPKQLVFNYTKK